MKRQPWPLPKLLERDRNAATVYAAIRWLAGNSRRLGATRERIAAVCGLYRDTISAAMHALAEAGWLTLNYGRQGVRTWYRLSFPVSGFFPVSAKPRYSKRAATGKNPLQQTVSCVGKNPTLSRKGEGRPSRLTRTDTLAGVEENAPESGPLVPIVELLAGRGAGRG